MTRIELSRDAGTGTTAVRLCGEADLRSAARVLDAMQAARTMDPRGSVRVDLTAAAALSPGFVVALARGVHTWRRAGRRVTVLVADDDAGDDSCASALLGPLAAVA
jgi:anti-anti-sigma regulatory factor